MAKLITTSHVRDYALSLSSAKARGFNRVGQSFLDRIDARVREIIEQEVRVHPSVGKTLK
jgi:hypothetical protein